MRKGRDIAVEFPGLYLVHHNLPGKEVDAHHHPQHTLFVPLQGEIRIELADQTFRCGPGRMVFIPAITDHRFYSSEQHGERLIALIDTKVWPDDAASCVPASLPIHQLCKELMFYLLLHPDTKNAKALILAFAQTLSEVLEARPAEGDIEHLSADHPGVQKALKLLQESIAEPLAMPEIARRSGLSLRSLNRQFLNDLGLTPKQYLAQLRVSHARELLLQGRSVTDASLSVGYSSLSQFIKLFRDVTGHLPSDIGRFGRK